MPDYRELVVWAAALAERLGKGKQRQLAAGSWISCCPAHDDENPSFRIDVDEQIRFQCFAGCDDEAIRKALLELGYATIPANTRSTGKTGATIVNKIAHAEIPEDEWFLGNGWDEPPDVIYTYRNEKEQPVFFVARANANPPERPVKRIQPICSSRAKGGDTDFWVGRQFPTGQGYVRPLYNLPELTQRPNSPVLIVEGEKAADLAKDLAPEYVVMTWSGGSNATKLSNWAVLQNREVTLWPDNDEPGIKSMRGIAAMLAKGRRAAKSVKLVFDETDTNFPDKWDLGDEYDESYPPLEFMLAGATEIDPTKLAETPMPADEGEVAARLQLFLDKYAAISVGPDIHYIDITSYSPFVGDMITYSRYSRNSLEQREVDAYLELVPGRAPKRRKFIEIYLESNRKLWLSGYVYDPSTLDRVVTVGNKLRLNLFCGLAFPPASCDPKLYQAFIDHVNASCSPAEANYLLMWLAAKVQMPQNMLGTMIILSGRQGCGKTIVCDIIGKMLGPHNAIKIPMADLTLTFNSQYANKLFIDVEEYNPGGSKMLKDLREKVKNLITSQTMLVNPKGIIAFENPAYHSVIATTNSTTPEEISFDNRRMTFINFDNQKLKMAGRLINDDAYFAPLVAMARSPAALSGLCNYLMEINVNWSVVTKPLSTKLTEEAMSFVEDPAFDFLRTIADTGQLPTIEDMPDADNMFPISKWPKQAAIIPRCTLNQMLRDYSREFRRETLSPRMAGLLLARTLPKTARGIPDSIDIAKSRRWSVINWQGATFQVVDRSFILPDMGELRAMLDNLAGTPITWSEIADEDDPSANVVVDFPGKTAPPSDDQF